MVSMNGTKILNTKTITVTIQNSAHLLVNKVELEEIGSSIISYNSYKQ